MNASAPLSTSATRAPASPCIGVFDSGVGGLTVLRELHRVLPGVPLHYVADSANAPYGQRTPEFIIQRCLVLTEHLRKAGAQVLVLACNTATAHAIGALRQRWPDMPIVGTEPGIKPAVAASRNGRIGVMATTSTIGSARYRGLIERHAGTAQVLSQACPGLVDLIETGELDSTAIQQLLRELCLPLQQAGVDTVLMGCTHYPLIQAQIQSVLGPQVQLLNIETAVAQQAARLWGEQKLAATATELVLETTGDATALSRFVQRALGWQLQARSLSI